MSTGSSALAGTASGAAMGSIAGPLGMAAGALVGGVVGGIQGNKERKAMNDIESQIRNAPKFTDSLAYANASNQASRADRFAQEGMSAQQYNNAQQNIDRMGSATLNQANDLSSGLMGMSAVSGNLTDAYTNLAMQDAQMKQQNRAIAMNANANLQAAQEEAFGVEMGRQQNLLDLQMGRETQSRQDFQNATGTMASMAQNYLNSDVMQEKFSNLGNRSQQPQQQSNQLGSYNNTQISGSYYGVTDPMNNGQQVQAQISPLVWGNQTPLFK